MENAPMITPERLAWGVPSPPRTYWPARLAILTAIALDIVLPDRLIPGPQRVRYIVPAIEVVVLLVLTAGFPHHTMVESHARRFTNATAFSPTDTMPLTPMAKVL